MPSFSIRVEGIRDAVPAPALRIGRLLSADRGRRDGGRDGRSALSRGAAPTGRTASPSPPRSRSASWKNRRGSRCGARWWCIRPSIRSRVSRTCCWESPARSKRTTAGWARISTASVRTRRSRARGTWTGRRRRTWAACRCANSRASRNRRVEMFLDREVPPELDAWFEHAIDCCAFLAWRLSNEGASIHFRSNGFELPPAGRRRHLRHSEIPGAGLPARRASAPEGPLEDTSYKIVFTRLAARIQRGRLDGCAHPGSRCAARAVGPSSLELMSQAGYSPRRRGDAEEDAEKAKQSCFLRVFLRVSASPR